MLGMVIGVCTVVLLIALGQGFQTGMTQTFNNMGASAFYISSVPSKTVVAGVRPLTNEDVAALQNKELVPSASVVSPTRTRNNVDVVYGNNDAAEQIIGIMPVVTQIRNYQVDSGRFIRRPGRERQGQCGRTRLPGSDGSVRHGFAYR